ncbi:MAG: fatty acyl-AMP ligase [Myxococcota bacterium]
MSRTPTDLVELLRERAQHQGADRAYTFLVDGDHEEHTLTYGALDAQARAIAARLQARGHAGQRALLLYPPGLEYVAAYFGCLYAGVVAVPAYPPRPNKPSPRLESIVTDAQAALALTTDAILQKLQPRFPEMPRMASLDWLTTDGVGTDGADAWRAPKVDGDTLAFLQYTSGTTGTPRGVMVTHGNLLHNSALIAEGFEHTVDDRGVFWLPIYHDMGLIGGVLQPLWIGRPTTLMPPAAFLQSPFRWLSAISRLKANVSGGPDMAYELCARQVTDEQKATLDLSGWELAFTGAEPIRPETLERFSRAFAGCGFRREAFYPCYGLAEATLMVTGGRRLRAPRVHRVERPALLEGRARPARGDDAEAHALVSCGRSLHGQEVRVVDPETGRTCADGEVGEIWVHGPCVARGYWNRAEASEAAFGGRRQDGPDRRYLRTADLGFIHEDELFYTGRMKDLLVVGGRHHYPQDLERTAELAHPALRPGFGAAFLLDDGKLALIYELERRARPDMNEVTGAVREAVRKRHGLPLHAFSIIRMLSIPKTSSGKIQRYACKAAFLDGSLETVHTWSAG